MVDLDVFRKVIFENNVNGVLNLVEAGADINMRDSQGQTPLFWTAQNNSLDIAQLLVKAGADVTICNNYGRSALDRAESPEMRQLLVRTWPQDHPHRLHALITADLTDELVDAVAAGADVNTRNERGQTPILRAAENDSLTAAEVLVEADADVTIRANDGQSSLELAKSPEMRQLLVRAWPQDHPLRLHALTKADLTDEVVETVAAGADVNARDEQGRTPLYWVIEKNNLAVAEMLVEAGADVTLCNNYGRSSLDCAKSPEMRQLLARAWPQDHPHQLHALAKADLVDEVVDAVAAGADVNARDEKGQLIFLNALQNDSLAAVEALARAGADVNVRDEDNLTPLFWSIQTDRWAAAEVLVKAGADVNARNEWGQTPLLFVIQKNSLAAAEVLVKAGADVTIHDNLGRSILDLAVSPEMRQLLARAWPQDHPLRLHALVRADLADEVADAVAAGADVNARDEQGQTPLLWAIQKNSLTAAEVLIKAGADVTLCDNARRSTLDCTYSIKMCQLLARAWPQDHLLRLHALFKADLADEVADAVAAGADINARDEQGRTPLFWAIEENSLAAAKVLIKAGADVTLCDNDGRSALNWAKSCRMRWLLRRTGRRGQVE